MLYLIYHKESKQVVEINEREPSVPDGYDFAISKQFELGDEFEYTIWINEVDNEKNVISYSAIRNNPQAQRLLNENNQLKAENAQLKSQHAELMLAVAELGALVTGGEK